MSDMNVVDLFSGVGGLSLGFKDVGFNIVLSNEYDNEIAESYIKNHKGTIVINEDISNLNTEETFSNYIDKIQVVIGGPPCQGFSQKGKRKSINDERNFLFRKYFHVVEYLKPKYFLMENVPNLLTTENGYFKNEIIEMFGSIGYCVDTYIFNAYDFGVPQIRKRAIIIGKYKDKPIKIVIPKIKKATLWDAISDIAYLNSGEGEFKQSYINNPQSVYQKKLRRNSEFLFNHIATNHSKIAIERLKLIPKEKGREYLPPEHITKSIYSGTWSRMKKDEPTVTITTRFDTPSSGKFTHPFLNRAITVREAARIQSFPDSFIFYGTKGSQMKQVGNAVPPLMAKHIAKQIKNDLVK
ncbi:DNA cytosine methyltransferase [Vallitalea guaymasensis]|uniref:DNA cytosine methyltransferase n=1 Tax=Vallitalea guaymasensis TaxID=1185412 RepID=UPI002357FF55|nr:DNA cytosine methyltransferase [Vallitalea guaymasensis]